MAASTRVKNFRNGTLKVEDGAALTLTIPFCKGDFALNGMVAGQREVKPVLIRGALADLYKGDQTFQTLSFSVVMTDVHDAVEQTLTDAVTKQGAWSAATSTFGSAVLDPYTVKFTWTIEGTDLGDASDHVYVVDDVHVDSVDVSESDPNEIKVTGTVYGTTTLT